MPTPGLFRDDLSPQNQVNKGNFSNCISQVLRCLLKSTGKTRGGLNNFHAFRCVLFTAPVLYAVALGGGVVLPATIVSSPHSGTASLGSQTRPGGSGPFLSSLAGCSRPGLGARGSVPFLAPGPGSGIHFTPNFQTATSHK